MDTLSTGVQQTIYNYLDDHSKIKLIKLSIIDSKNIMYFDFFVETLNKLNKYLDFYHISILGHLRDGLMVCEKCNIVFDEEDVQMCVSCCHVACYKCDDSFKEYNYEIFCRKCIPDN